MSLASLVNPTLPIDECDVTSVLPPTINKKNGKKIFQAAKKRKNALIKFAKSDDDVNGMKKTKKSPK